MTRIQHLAGILEFGENDDTSIYYDEALDRFVIEHKKITNKGAQVGVDLYPDGLTQDQPFTVRAQASLECTVNRVVMPSGTDTVSHAGAGATNHVGVAMETIAAAQQGQIAVAGCVDVDCTNAATAGQYLVCAANGQVTCQGALPANGTLVGIARETTGGAGLVRCWLRLGAY